MTINMPLVTSELFFSSDEGTGPIKAAESRTGRQTPSDKSTSSFPLTAEEDCGSANVFVDGLEDADDELFVDVSRELAAIEGTEGLSALQAGSAKDGQLQGVSFLQPQSSKPPKRVFGAEAPATRQAALQAPEYRFLHGKSGNSRLHQVGQLSRSWNIR